jgi:hypothetical protein
MICHFCSEKLRINLQFKPYNFCPSCKIYIRTSGDHQSLMINEVLKSKNKVDKLILSQLGVLLEYITPMPTGLVDFGCGGGGFLLASRPYFPKVVGVEITPESVLAAQSEGLEIKSEIPKKGYSVITFWHSLEHLPYPTFKKVLQDIAESEIQNVMLSVPNANSITLSLFGRFVSFVDVENHPFIYSQEFLVESFKEIGFSMKSKRRIRSYTIFGSLQSAINFITRSHNQLYFVLKRGHKIRTVKVMRHLLLVPVYIPVATITLLMTLFDLSRDPVINLGFQRIPPIETSPRDDSN